MSMPVATSGSMRAPIPATGAVVHVIPPPSRRAAIHPPRYPSIPTARPSGDMRRIGRA